MCRLCGNKEETVNHIVNECALIEGDGMVTDVFSLLQKDIETVVVRVKRFLKIAKEKKEAEEKEGEGIETGNLLNQV